ncbi:hypothetical protein QTP86_018786, partial [Hemibagrus guttatus]
MQQPQRSVQTPRHKIQAPPFTSSPCKTTPQPSFSNDANVSEIARDARTRNDPSFALASGINSVLKLEQPFKRRELVAVTADIEQMFHSFIVKEADRGFLCFLWFKENDTSKEIIEYRMRVHVFGNSPSPAVAIYGLRQAAAYDEKEYGSDAKHFVEREFYVYDGLLSTPTAVEAIDLLTRTKEMLATSNLKLHKFASNSKEVMVAFPIEDHAKGLKDLNLEVDPTPIQRSLGLSRDVKRDVFTFHVTDIKKPFTRRGILATVNSLFDPLGFVAPIIIEGKFLLRELSGPTFLLQVHQNLPLEEEFDLIGPELDVEVRPLVTIISTDDSHLECQRFERFSSWRSLVRAIASLIHVAQTFKSSDDTERTCRSWHYCAKPHTVKELLQAEEVVIKSVQRRAYQEELTCIAKGNDIPMYSALRKLNPYIDSRGLLRIGGQLKNATLDLKEKFPLIIPGRSHAAKLLVEHYHRVKHQGRVFTESTICNAGYWIVGVKKLINSILHKCVMCNKLRGKVTEQKMADLPIDCLSTEQPFTYVGLDVFGPWTVVMRCTRGGQAQSKRWAVLFTCMSTRAIHIELIDFMDSSTFINALRRFFALQGPAKQIRSDCGTNFVGACKELEIVLTDSQQPSVKRYLGGEGCSWVFNPPHASHMGGAWERMIGVSRRILDSMLQQISPSCLTHEVLSALMAEVIGIVNSRPLVPISSDPDSPFLLTPAMLLTQKGHSVLPY